MNKNTQCIEEILIALHIDEMMRRDFLIHIEEYPEEKQKIALGLLIEELKSITQMRQTNAKQMKNLNHKWKSFLEEKQDKGALAIIDNKISSL